MRTLLLAVFFSICMPLWAAEPTAQAAPVAPQLEPVVGMGDLLQVLFALLVVILLIFSSAWFFRRFSAGSLGQQGALRVLATTSVGQRERVVLVQAGEVQMLLGVSPGSVRTLHVFDKPVLLESEATGGHERFSDRLKSAMNTMKKEESS